MKTVKKLSAEQKEFLYAYGTVLNGKYFFMPYWFKKVNETDFELIRLGELPPELVDLIKDFRTLQP